MLPVARSHPCAIPSRRRCGTGTITDGRRPALLYFASQLVDLRYRILKKSSLVFSALAALVTAGILAGCGNNYYFAGRVLPPSGIANRVLIAVQNPSTASKGVLQFVDAFYDIRHNYKDTIASFSI